MRRRRPKHRRRGGIQLSAAVALCLAVSLLMFARAGGEELLGPGDTIRVTPGVLHDFYNVGDAPAVVLAVTF